MSKKILLSLALLVILLAAFLLYQNIDKVDQPTEPKSSANQQTDEPKIVSTKPDPLENAVVSATEAVEITFNRPLENIGEFKFRIDPKADVKIELSPDRKTAKIIPQTPYGLGVTYTVFIGPESKFDGVGNWGKEAIYHFQTIKFRGI